MNVKTRRNIQIIKTKLLSGWYFCMKPLAKLITYCEDKKSEKRHSEVKNMSLDEVARLYVKCTVKYMVKRKDPKLEYYCCTKKDGYSDYYEDGFILSDLEAFGWSRFAKTKLRNWCYDSPDCQAIKWGDKSKERWITLENKLRALVEKEFIRVGCKIEYVDESDKLDKWFVDQSGYESTMIVTI